MIENSITVGLEIEMSAIKKEQISQSITSKYGFRRDASILDDKGKPLPKKPWLGIEMVTPIMEVQGSLNGPVSMPNVEKAVADILSTADKVNSSCGVHVHLGKPSKERSSWNPQRSPGVDGGPKSVWKPAHVRTMLAIGLALEDRVFSFVPASRAASIHCKKIRDVYSPDALMAYYPIKNPKPRKYDNPERYCWLNLLETCRPSDPEEHRVGYARSEKYGTIEIRALGETKNFAYILAWVQYWVKIASAVAELSPEQAIIKCAYSGWLNDLERTLLNMKNHHEAIDAWTNRSVIATSSDVGGEE